MELINKLYLFAATFLVVGITFAQQDSQYTQYMYNTAIINPAYVGSRETLGFFGLYRNQWIGISGAPETATFSISAPLGYTGLGAGLSFVGDKIGASSDSTISTDISYTIDTSDRYKLAFGVKGSVNLFSLDPNKLQIYSPTDPFLQPVYDDISPNVGAGVYFYSENNYLGISVPNFFQAKKYSDNERAVYIDKMHLYLMGGHVFDLSRNLIFKPAFLLKQVEGAPLQLDLSCNFTINKKFDAGVSWRWGGTISSLVGFQINEGFFVGYGYDRELTRLSNYNSGTHEIFLRFDLFREGSFFSPRFF